MGTECVKLKIRLAQIAPRLGDIQRNLDTHREAIERAAGDGVGLLVFPELSLTGYYLRDLAAEVAIRADDECLLELAALAGPMAVVLGFVEGDRGGRVFCSAACLAAGGVAHVHRKVYLPTYGMFDEGRYLTPGDEVRAFEGEGWRAGLLVCEDCWHLSPPLLLARQGTDLLIALACSPARGVAGQGLSSQAAWEDMLPTYARLLQQFVVFCNRVGYEDGVCFWGGSGVWSPEGQALARAPVLDAATVDCEVDLRDLYQVRASSPLLADERDELTLREMERVARGRA